MNQSGFRALGRALLSTSSVARSTGLLVFPLSHTLSLTHSPFSLFHSHVFSILVVHPAAVSGFSDGALYAQGRPGYCQKSVSAFLDNLNMGAPYEPESVVG